MANQIMYGFEDLESVFDRRVSEAGVETVTDAVRATVEEHNRQMNEMLSLFVEQTDQFKVRFQTPNSARLQPLDQNGRARPIQPSGEYDVAFPLQDAGIAWGANFRARAKMTVGEVNRTLQVLTMADQAWMRDHVLAALFTNAAWTFNDPEHGDLTIKGLANSDTDTFLIQQGQLAGATDNHYLATADAIADATDPFEDIVTELEEHPENSGEILVLTSTSLKSSIQNLTSFFKQGGDPNIRQGANTAELVGSYGGPVPGKLLGYHDAGAWVAEWPVLPAGYLVALAVGGERPIAMRQEEEASLRGFSMVAEREDYPFWEAQYLRIAGFGAWNRVGALVYRIGNGTYAIPTNYTSPMA